MLLERRLKGWDQLRKLIKRQTRKIQELRGAGLQVSEPYTSHGTCLLSLSRDVRGASYHKESEINSNRNSCRAGKNEAAFSSFFNQPNLPCPLGFLLNEENNRCSIRYRTTCTFVGFLQYLLP